MKTELEVGGGGSGTADRNTPDPEVKEYPAGRIIPNCAVLPKSDTTVPVVCDPPVACRYAEKFISGNSSDTSNVLVSITL
jgi:hypothetical protein